MIRKGFYVLILAFVSSFMMSSAVLAVDNVICVPWQGDVNKYHTTTNGLSVLLKAVLKTDDTGTRYYKWVFGDGSPDSAVTALSGSTKYNLEIAHTYTGAVGTPFTAKLLVDADDNSMANAVEDTYFVRIEEPGLDANVNVAIDKGLWWLYKNHYTHSYLRTFDNSPFMAWNQTSYGSYFASPTASAIQAFAINNHKFKGNPNQDPYVEAVQLGMNFLMKGYYYSGSYPMLRALNVSTQHSDNPEAGQISPNGYGIEVRDYDYRPIYEGGQVMDAIIASGVLPSDLTGRDFTRTDSTVVANWTFGQLLQDMADMYAYGQCDNTSGSYGIIGGWRYNWGDWPDNSAAQWAAIGLIPAQKSPWNVIVPDWVKNYNENWLDISYYQWAGALGLYGGFGYNGSGWGYNTSASGLVQMVLEGQVGFDDPGTPGDDRDVKWANTERFYSDTSYWNNFLNGNHTYGWYALAKAMRLALPSPIERLVATNFDWYRGGALTGLAQRILNTQNAAGYWSGEYTNYPLTTAWMIIILKPALFQAAPIACFTAHPNPSYADQDIIFDPSCSSHSETGKDIGNLIMFEWDWDNNGVYDNSTVDPEKVMHSFSCSSLPCTYPVKLRVTDDAEEPLTATFTLDINITNPPHPPVSNPGGPYIISTCNGDTSVILDGSTSFDPDEGQHEAGCTTCPDDAIQSWQWDFYGAPYDYTDGSGETAEASYSGQSVGIYNIGLKVTDKTSTAYPASGQPDLTDESFTTLTLIDGCICNLAARVKSGKVQLTWAHLGGGTTYDVYRSTEGPNSGFVLVAEDLATTYATYLDTNVVNGTKYYYRVVASTGCGSNMASAIPTTRTRR